MMKVCPKCGYDNSTFSQACYKCKEDLNRIEASAATSSYKPGLEEKVRVGIRWFLNIFVAIAALGCGAGLNFMLAEFDRGWIIPVLGIFFAVISSVCFIFFDIVLRYDMPRLFKFPAKTNFWVAVGAIGGIVLSLTALIINLVLLYPPIN